MKELGHGSLIAIDPYSPDESAKHETQESSVWWHKLNHDAILGEFEGYIQTFGLQNIVTVKRMTSDAFDPSDLEIEILHIDGAHGPQALRDAQRYCSHVRLGGYVVMDDINWYVDGQFTVRKAVEWMESHGFRKLYDVVKHHNIPNEPQDDWGVWQKL
jgi:hypothetical protein